MNLTRRDFALKGVLGTIGAVCASVLGCAPKSANADVVESASSTGAIISRNMTAVPANLREQELLEYRLRYEELFLGKPLELCLAWNGEYYAEDWVRNPRLYWSEAGKFHPAQEWHPSAPMLPYISLYRGIHSFYAMTVRTAPKDDPYPAIRVSWASQDVANEVRTEMRFILPYLREVRDIYPHINLYLPPNDERPGFFHGMRKKQALELIRLAGKSEECYGINAS